MPIPKLPSADDGDDEQIKSEHPNSNQQEQSDITRGKRNLQALLLRNQENGDQQIINPAIVATAVPEPSIDQDSSGDCQMHDNYKVQKYFEQETPFIEQPSSTDVEDPAELSVVTPSPLTAIDASSMLEESQELKIIDELSKQLADYSAAPSLLPGNTTSMQNSQHSQEVDARLDASLIQEVQMSDAERVAALVAQFPIQDGQVIEDSAVDLIEESPPANGTACTTTGDVAASNGIAPRGLPDRVIPPATLSFEEQRQLTHVHTLKQIVSRDASLTSMAFDEQDHKQAAVIYDNLNATACFYTTALRILSKADWSIKVEFEDHIVHQAMKAVAQGWTTAVNLRNRNFGPFHLALAMCALPKQVHGEVQRTFDSMAVNLSAPFLQKICSLVTFDCGVCGVSSSHFVSTFFVLQPLPQNALGHDFFNSAAPWTDRLLLSDTTSEQQYCNECASSSNFLVNTSAASRLVWLQYIRESHPPANTYRNFLGKDSLFSSGYSWQCVALIIHQGHDPLNGDQQPAEHFYVLENEGPKSKFLCYNNAVGLHYIDDSKIREGDRICGFLFRTPDVATKWSGPCTYAVKKIKNPPARKLGFSKKFKTSGTGKNLQNPRKKGASNDTTKKQDCLSNERQTTLTPFVVKTSDVAALETYGPPPDDSTTVPAETVQIIEDEISQFSEIPQTVLTTPSGGGDPSHCPSLVVRSSQMHSPGMSRPGPYTIDPQHNGGVEAQTKPPPKHAAANVTQKGPYAILSMFDGCGSSVDIIETKFGYRPKACILCEKDETLRYLVGEKHGITVDQRWQHSLKGGGAFYYAKDVDNLFVDNARLLRELAALLLGEVNWSQRI